MHSKRDPEFGAAYTFDEVAAFYPHDQTPDFFALVSGPRVVALRLREDEHPKIFETPAQLWVGEKPNAVRDWGKALASETARIPVFVRRNGKRNYTFVGDHVVLLREPTPAEVVTALVNVPHPQGISRIVFLKRV